MECEASHCSFSDMASMRLNIDFSPSRRAPARSLLLLTAAFIVFGIVARNTLFAFDETRNISLRLAATSLEQASKTTTLSQGQIDAINRAIRQLNLPWEHLFAEIETHLGSRVVLLALEPDASNWILRLQGEAKSVGDMLGFSHALEKSTFFSGAILVRHEINEADRNRPLRFVVEARWPAD